MGFNTSGMVITQTTTVTTTEEYIDLPATTLPGAPQGFNFDPPADETKDEDAAKAKKRNNKNKNKNRKLAAKKKTVEDKLWDIGAAVDRKINAAGKKIDEAMSPGRPKSPKWQSPEAEDRETELDHDTFYYHNHPKEFPQNDSTTPNMLIRSSESIVRAITRRPKVEKDLKTPAKSAKPSGSANSARQTEPSSQIEPTEYQAEYYGSAGIERIKHWAGANSINNPGEIDWEKGDYFIACTLKQLRELDSETINDVRVVKSYIGPPSTPVPEQEILEVEPKDEVTTGVADGTSPEEDDAVNPSIENMVTTPAAETNYQTPTALTEFTNSQHGVAISTTPFPEYIDEDAITMFNGSNAENEEAMKGRDGASHAEEDDITVIDSARPDMDDFRLNPNRPDIDMTPRQIANYEDYAPVDFTKGNKRIDPQTIHQDLARILGTRNYGIQVVGTNLPITHDTIENMSDYYNMPLIELAEPVEPFQIPQGTEENESIGVNVNDAEGQSKKVKAGNTDLVFLPKQTQPASFSLVLFLTGKGLPPSDIVDIILTLDYKFLDGWDSRWFNGCRIPEHWEMNNAMVEKIKVLCKAPEYWWEEMYGKKGEVVTMAMRKLWFNHHENRSAQFVRLVLENYVRLRAGLAASEASRCQRFVEKVLRK